MKLVYVAGPFTAPTAWQIAENVRAAERAGLQVACCGAMPVIPHANTANFHGTCTPEFWYAGTLELLRRCDAIVLIDGWRGSRGAVIEKETAEKRGMPVFILNYFGNIPGLSEWCEKEPQ